MQGLDIVTGTGVLLVTFGIVGVVIGWKRRAIYQTMTETEAVDIREINSPGVIEVEGRVEPVDDLLEAPITGRNGTFVAWKVEEWDERGDTDTWRNLAHGIASVPFAVDDDTAAIRIDPGDVHESAGKWTQVTGVAASDGVVVDDVLAEFDTFPVEEKVEREGTTPAHIRTFHAKTSGLEDASDSSYAEVIDVGRKHGDRRYREQVIEPGEDVYVFGAVEGRDDDREHLHPDRAEIVPPDDGVMIVSNQSEASIESEYASSYRFQLRGGIVGLLAGGALLALAFL